MWTSKFTQNDVFEMDELFHFTKKRPRTKTRENMYVIPLISRTPRQIVSFGVEKTKTAKVFQKIVDIAPPAKQYNTDGNFTYMDVVFPGTHRRNDWDKKDTCRIESVNSDLRHYIPGLRRRSKCFYRSLATLRAILSIFVNAYNKFGEAKLIHRERLLRQYGPLALNWNHYKDPPFSLFDFV